MMNSVADEPFSEQPSAAAEQGLRLSEVWDLLRRRWRLVGVCLLAGAAVSMSIAFSEKPTYRATTMLLLERGRNSPVEMTGLESTTYDPEFLPTHMRLMKSREVGERMARALGYVDESAGSVLSAGAPADIADAADVADALRSRIDTRLVRGTSLVELSCVAPTPAKAAELANGAADAFLAWIYESRFKAVEEASRFLGGQVDQIRKEIAEKETQLLAYGRQKDIISMEPGANVTLQKLGALNQDYAAAVADRVAKEARYHEVKTSPPEAVAEAASGGQVTLLRNEVSKLERDYDERLSLFKPEWPAMQQLKSQIENARAHLTALVRDNVRKAQETARSDYLTALRRESSLKQVLEGQKSEAMTLSSNAVEYNSLKVEIDTKRALLDNLLKRQAETAVAANLRGDAASNFRIVERALPPDQRYSPSYRQSLMVGLGAGAAAGLGLVGLLLLLDRTLRTPERLEKALRLPALAMIPDISVGPSASRRGLSRLLRRKPEATAPGNPIELVPHASPRSPAAEAYRGLRTAILLSRAGGVKSILVTSARPHEGKSATASNLAIVLAQIGKRVVLIDADLHRPRQHEIFRVSNRSGLVSILAEGMDPGAAVVKTVVPGLSLLPSGPSTPNPSGLLSSEAMQALLEYAGMNYDYVVVDVPPIFPVADALVLGPHADGVVLCVQWGVTSLDLVARACETLRRGRFPILGAVLNRVSESVPGYATAYDYYGESYGAPEEPTPRPGAVAGLRG